MGSRKESMKKALGITEYPWSSDEDDAPQPAQDVPLLRREPGESRHSVSDMPGTSGLSTTPPAAPAPTPVRRNQASRMDRELFWSVINNHTPVGVLRNRSHRLNDLNYSLRSVAPSSLSSGRDRASERSTSERSPVSNIQHILQVLSSRRSSGSSRSTLFSPAMSSSRACRAGPAYRRLTARTSLPPYTRTASSSSMYPSNERMISASLPRRLRRHGADCAVDLSSTAPVPVEVNIIDDRTDEEAEQQASPAAPARTDRSEDNENAAAGEAEAASPNVEVVDLDASDEPGPSRPPDTDPEGEQVQPTTSTQPAATQEAASRSERHGVKRKREGDDDTPSESTSEPFTVKDFNQSLLRLLECPVCLEWMEPPISQCRRGHLVCSRCRARLASCPVCRTTFSSVRNRAMEGVAEMLRYPCRHACGREVRLRRRAAHEASCRARHYACPAPACARRPPLPHAALGTHFQSKHMTMLKIGRRHKLSMKVNSEQHDTWLIMAMDEYFHLRVDVDLRSWGVIVYVAYIGPKCNAKNFTYEVSLEGQHNARRLVYTRSTHCDLESSSFNVSLQDCFHLTLDQALNFLRLKTKHSDPDKYLDFNVDISKCEGATAQREDSDS